MAPQSGQPSTPSGSSTGMLSAGSTAHSRAPQMPNALCSSPSFLLPGESSSLALPDPLHTSPPSCRPRSSAFLVSHVSHMAGGGPSHAGGPPHTGSQTVLMGLDPTQEYWVSIEHPCPAPRSSFLGSPTTLGNRRDYFPILLTKNPTFGKVTETTRSCMASGWCSQGACLPGLLWKPS